MKKLDNRKFIRAATVVLLSLFLIAFVSLCIRSCRVPGKRGGQVTFSAEFIQKHSFLPPSVPVLPDDYYLLRGKDYRWTAADVSRWFTPPEGALLDELHASNERMIADILGAAP
ncbi:hypothetical protein [Treponema brennaborense]|uniref:Uncharacterized protein n=1 Tax=Treponema brennaborense (strain DSM 12168 / CIP 105900 / DD5/3) TaxID=906968 RepID=F4LPC9_TREBD|nr:hypothetical protein [Treponema brennaborense]AEE16991.1 hypothetical protein Trebr_1568 [Treponema brennaborense DSM 12168]